MRTLPALLLAALAITWSAPLHAGSIDYLSNQSADYIRTFSRNASTEPDAVTYNPAGTAWLKDGLHFSLSTQTLFKDYLIEYQGDDYTANDPTWILPSFFAAYKWRDLAAFAAFTVPAGGGSLTYGDGVPYLIPLGLAAGGRPEVPQEARFEGSSMYLAGSFGAAYRLYNIVSLSAAGRVISASRSFQGFATYRGLTNPDETVTAELDTEKTALGFGGIFGVHVRPLPQLDIGIRYETETPLEFTAETTASANLSFIGALTSFADGAKEKRNLPSVLAAGLSYAILPQLVATSSFNYYFINQADDGEDEGGASPYVVSYDDDYANGFDLAFSVAYQVIPQLWLSLGYNWANAGGNENTFYDFEYPLDSHSVCGGGKLSLLEDRLALVLGISATLYDEGTNTALHPTLAPNPETFDKQVITIALGAEYRLF